jgi:hypothetical protein
MQGAYRSGVKEDQCNVGLSNSVCTKVAGAIQVSRLKFGSRLNKAISERPITRVIILKCFHSSTPHILNLYSLISPGPDWRVGEL